MSNIHGQRLKRYPPVQSEWGLFLPEYIVDTLKEMARRGIGRTLTLNYRQATTAIYDLRAFVPLS
jgi:hypothetical protein